MESGKKRAEETGQSSGGSALAERQEKIEEVFEGETTDDDSNDDDDDLGSGVGGFGFVPTPLIPLQEQLEKDKEDESLKRWKEKLLGHLDSDLIRQKEPEVKFISIGIISDEFGEITTPLPVSKNQTSQTLFTLKEGSHFRLKLTFTVLHNIVSCLSYSNTVWKKGFQVDQSKGMLGTFAPQHEPYVEILEEETTPSGVLARGLYSAKLKFKDDDRKCYMELKYNFQIKRGS